VCRLRVVEFMTALSRPQYAAQSRPICRRGQFRFRTEVAIVRPENYRMSWRIAGKEVLDSYPPVVRKAVGRRYDGHARTAPAGADELTKTSEL
jgi:hypothetical protein